MYSALKIFSRKSKSEEGFVLIIALVAVVILIAVGFYVLTVSSKDVFVASRLIGERKAFSAAEAGVHVLCRDFKPSVTISGGYVDSVNDPTIKYSFPAPGPQRSSTMPTVDLPGFDMAKAYVGAVFNTTVTGEDTRYGSSVTISVGTAYAPNPSDTQQGNQ